MVIVGECNINFDCQTDADIKQLNDFLTSVNFRQRVQVITHVPGHILDPVISSAYQ